MNMMYRYLDAEGLRKTIGTQSLRLAKITSLNDPFDFNPIIKLAELSDDELRNAYRLNSDKHCLNISKMTNSELREDRLSRANKFSLSMREIASQYFGVLCFSKLHDSPLLWAHYGDRHRGANIGFDIEQPPFSNMKGLNCPVDVFYQKDRPIFYRFLCFLKSLQFSTEDRLEALLFL